MELDYDATIDAAPDLSDRPSSTAAPATSEQRDFLSTVAAGPRDRRLALVLVGLSTLGFLAAIPFARTPLPRVAAFIPAYESALALNDLISAVLLFGQFYQLRRRALLALASGYLFDALIIVPHALSFPGVFAETGLLGAGPQTTGWLYVFWHGGFALCALAYGILGHRDGAAATPYRRPGIVVAYAVLAVAASVVLITVATTAGHDYLPVIVQGSDFSLLVAKGISPAVLALSLAAVIVLWRRPQPVVLDLWIMVVLCAWLFDVALSAAIGSSRFDLGWYVGRSYGLLAASFVLIVLLVETTGLQGRLAAANDALAEHARTLGARVRDRTKALADSNAALRREIAERKQTEAQLVHAQKMEAIGNLTGGMAHDFNNLLGVIIGNLDMLCETTQDDRGTDELATEALDAALRGADLTKRLLAFARRQPLQPRLVDINDHVGAISKLLGRTLGEQVAIKHAFVDDVWPVMADPAQLEASLTNLATNARDAMPGGGHLTIRTGNRTLDEDYAAQHAELHAGDYAMIEVSDTGSGMPPETLNRIFEPFFTTKDQGKGTGLGLSMVFGFMKQSGGHINVYSELGVGTTFRLYLPRAVNAAPAAEAKPVAKTPRGNDECVLVVEDNERLRRIVVRQLVDLGYRVLKAADAHGAIAVLEEHDVDLLFSDVVMPGGTSGYELARMARDRWPDMKVVLTSGFPDTRLAGSGDIYVRLLSKPYRKDDLGRTVREALDT